MSLSLLWFSAWFFPSFFLGWVNYELSCGSTLLLYCQTWRPYYVFFAAGSGFSFVAWSLCDILGGLLLQYFALFHRVPGAMQQAFFPSGRPIAHVAWISYLAIASAALLGVGRAGIFSSFLSHGMTGAVGICPRWGLKKISTFVDFFCNFRYFE